MMTKTIINTVLFYNRIKSSYTFEIDLNILKIDL